jgi:hypothetical protein
VYSDDDLDAPWNAYERLRKRVVELEAALRPLAALMTNLRTDEIGPKSMYVMTTTDGDDCDLIGQDIINARKTLLR